MFLVAFTVTPLTIAMAILRIALLAGPDARATMRSLEHVVAQEHVVMGAVKAAPVLLPIPPSPAWHERRDALMRFYEHALQLETIAAVRTRIAHHKHLSQRQAGASRDPALWMRANLGLHTHVRRVPAAEWVVVWEGQELMQLLRRELGDLVQLELAEQPLRLLDRRLVGRPS